MKNVRFMTALMMATMALACSSSSSSGGGAAGNDASTSGTDGSAAAPDAGGADASTDAPTSHDAAPAAVAKLKVNVPSTYTGTARQLVVVVEQSLPPMGPPAGILLQKNAPTVTAGASLSVDGDPAGLSGDYYVLVVLFMPGGGTQSPKSGIDYVATSAAKVHFDGTSVDLGSVDLALAK